MHLYKNLLTTAARTATIAVITENAQMNLTMKICITIALYIYNISWIFLFQTIAFFGKAKNPKVQIEIYTIYVFNRLCRASLWEK